MRKYNPKQHNIGVTRIPLTKKLVELQLKTLQKQKSPYTVTYLHLKPELCVCKNIVGREIRRITFQPIIGNLILEG